MGESGEVGALRNIRLNLAYDGTAYHGFQSQPDKRLRTIEDMLVAAIHRLTGEEPRVICAGRTDARVHAVGQVANFHTESSIPVDRWALALNSVLPPDIRVVRAQEVAPDFHARFSARGKTYRYLIQNGRVPAVLWRNYAYLVFEPLDLSAMQEASRHLLGTHDFSSFRASGCSARRPVRTVRRLEWREIPLGLGDPAGMTSWSTTAVNPVPEANQGGSPAPPETTSLGRLLAMVIEADAFLYNMVRIIAGTMIEVGKGKISPDGVASILAARDRRRAGPTAAAHGLCLLEVNY